MWAVGSLDFRITEGSNYDLSLVDIQINTLRTSINLMFQSEAEMAEWGTSQVEKIQKRSRNMITTYVTVCYLIFFTLITERKVRTSMVTLIKLQSSHVRRIPQEYS